jgi:hypothetical protein
MRKAGQAAQEKTNLGLLRQLRIAQPDVASGSADRGCTALFTAASTPFPDLGGSGKSSPIDQAFAIVKVASGADASDPPNLPMQRTKNMVGAAAGT